jgi:hypothetical protein
MDFPRDDTARVHRHFQIPKSAIHKDMFYDPTVMGAHILNTWNKICTSELLLSVRHKFQ